MCTKDITLKASCADAFYYPSEWDPSKGSLDSFQRKRGFEHHFGRRRTKNLHKGSLVIRFEMPFKVQCLRCSTYIGQGTRYDADKIKVGMYFSTPIYEFSMRCRVGTDMEKSADGRIYCNERFVIRTDPEHRDYKLVEGLRRKAETWDPADAETIELPDSDTRREMDADPMFKMDHTNRIKEKTQRENQRLRELLELQEDRSDAYAANCALRAAHRKRRKEERAEEEKRIKAGPLNFALPLLPPTEHDAREAKMVCFRTDHQKIERAVKRSSINATSLFKRPSCDQSDGGLPQLVAKRRRLEQAARMARLFATG